MEIVPHLDQVTRLEIGGVGAQVAHFITVKHGRGDVDLMHRVVLRAGEAVGHLPVVCNVC